MHGARGRQLLLGLSARATRREDGGARCGARFGVGLARDAARRRDAARAAEPSVGCLAVLYTVTSAVEWCKKLPNAVIVSTDQPARAIGLLCVGPWKADEITTAFGRFFATCNGYQGSTSPKTDTGQFFRLKRPSTKSGDQAKPTKPTKPTTQHLTQQTAMCDNARKRTRGDWKRSKVRSVWLACGIKMFYEEDEGVERKVRAESLYGTKAFFEGEQGVERKVRKEFPDGHKEFYEGEKGAERLVHIEFPDGHKVFFVGEQGVERKVRAEFLTGNKAFYEGEKGAERKVRIECPDGTKVFFVGGKGAERKVRAVYTTGHVWFFEGGKGAERKVRFIHDGIKEFYEGEKGAERMVRVEFPNDQTHFFEGDEDVERLVRVECSDGAVQFYEGEKGAERKVCVEFPTGHKVFYEGEQGAERKVRVQWPDGNMAFYEGEQGAERMVRVASDGERLMHPASFTSCINAALSDTAPQSDLPTCSVCFEPKTPNMAVLMPCLHTFCVDCADRVVGGASRDKRCPECRGAVCGAFKPFV